MPGTVSAVDSGFEELYASLSVSSNLVLVLPEVVTSPIFTAAGSDNVMHVVGGSETDSYTCSCKFFFLLLFFLHTEHIITNIVAVVTVKNTRVHASTTTSTLVVLFSADFVRSTQRIHMYYMRSIMFIATCTIFIDDSGNGSGRFQVNIRWDNHAISTSQQPRECL